MNRDILKLIYKISDDFNNNPEKTNSDIYKLSKKVAEKVFNNEFDETILIKRNIDDEFITEKVSDYNSYNLGKLHQLIEFLSMLDRLYEVEGYTKQLKSSELDVLKIIQEERDIGAFDIVEKLQPIDYKDVAETLGKLRERDLVKRYSVGRQRWYSLTLKGKEVIEKVNN